MGKREEKEEKKEKKEDLYVTDNVSLNTKLSKSEKQIFSYFVSSLVNVLVFPHKFS